VLGTLLRRGVEGGDAPRLPADVEQRWASAWGEAIVEAARRQIASRPALDLSFASDEEAQAYAVEHGGISLARRHVRLTSASVAELAGFEQGRWWVQDLAASLPARLIPEDAAKVLDLCAAPGGKTMQIAAAGHDVTSVDSSESRLGRLSENLARTQLRAELIHGDALQCRPQHAPDAILLDAPCSATGTFRRHPEVLYRAKSRSIAEAAALQRKLLEQAATQLPMGGALVYAVCSLEPEEGERVVTHFLDRHREFRIDPPRAGELPDFVPVDPNGWARILPGLLEEQGGLDGFFIARLVRSA
jgi:16S rRNA (cytosine967-C5)-methyltransferase